ncbi:MAG: Hsp20/alpha crystallin family protein [Erysipelotrichales bacterium]|nr:Hsp20/alpha crystallin family protein [Erysipelotrichales bacterium]
MRYLTRMNDVFDDLFTLTSFKENTMKCDIVKKDGNYILDIDLPGYSKEDIELSLEDGYLTISAKQESTKEENNQGYIHKERYVGTSSRSFYVGDRIQEEDIKAMYQNGTLTITLPETPKQLEEDSRKYISIE